MSFYDASLIEIGLVCNGVTNLDARPISFLVHVQGIKTQMSENSRQVILIRNLSRKVKSRINVKRSDVELSAKTYRNIGGDSKKFG